MSWHGIEALAELPHLHALGMECNNTAPLHATFGALSKLTRLSMLEVGSLLCTAGHDASSEFAKSSNVHAAIGVLWN